LEKIPTHFTFLKGFQSERVPQSNDRIRLVMDEEINIERKSKMLISIFSMYEGLPEHHIFKNRYFACIVHIFPIE
jgi:hypothetical protein